MINIGVCNIDLLEIENAVKNIESCLSLAETDYCIFNTYEADACFFILAFLKSYLGFREEASSLAEKAYTKLSENFINDFWTTGYRLLFIGLTYKNLGEIEKSFEMFHKALLFAEETHYTQVKGKALDGLAQIYQEQKDFETALSNHAEAIKLLDKIGAKCDLAEAYYQIGLTYQKMGEVQKSQENFDKAIQLFSEMEAPKQIEKVRRAMESER